MKQRVSVWQWHHSIHTSTDKKDPFLEPAVTSGELRIRHCREHHCSGEDLPSGICYGTPLYMRCGAAVAAGARGGRCAPSALRPPKPWTLASLACATYHQIPFPAMLNLSGSVATDGRRGMAAIGTIAPGVVPGQPRLFQVSVSCSVTSIRHAAMSHNIALSPTARVSAMANLDPASEHTLFTAATAFGLSATVRNSFMIRKSAGSSVLPPAAVSESVPVPCAHFAWHAQRCGH